MFCPQCGSQNPDNGAFCQSCGKSLQAAPSAKPNAQQYSYRQPAAYQPAPTQEGVLGAAWRDITGTAGWLKKVLFLCLIGCVPILNLSVSGYALRWSRELSFGQRNPLPKEVFKKKEILTGFRAWLAQVSLGFVFLIAGGLAFLLLVGIFSLFSPQAGAVMAMICLVVLLVGFVFFYLPFVNVSVMRMTVVDYLEASFNLPKTLKAFRGGMGSAIGATVVPPLVIGLIQAILSAIITAIIGGMAASAANSMYSSSYLYYSSDPIGQIVQMGAGIIFMYLVMEIVMMMLSTFAMLLTWRAMGHWTARYASRWVDESDEETILRMADERAASRAETQATSHASSYAAAPAPAPAPAPKPAPAPVTGYVKDLGTDSTPPGEFR